MNNDLISREALRKAFHERIWYFTKSSWDEANALIDNAPTVDIKDQIAGAYNEGFMCGNKEAEKARPQGEWIDEGQYAEGHSEHAYLCKNCGYQIIELPNMIPENRFCKYCGADMRKGGAENEIKKEISKPTSYSYL